MKSTQQLGQEAREFEFNPNIPLHLYLKTCLTLLNNASECFQRGDKSLSYFYYFRYVDLCTNKLPNHPTIRSTSTGLDNDSKLYVQEYKQLLRLEVPHILKIMEELKTELDAMYERHKVSLANNIASPISYKHNNRMDALLHDYYTERGCTGHSMQHKTSLHKNENFNERINLMKDSFMGRAPNGSQEVRNVSNTFYPDLPTLS